MQKVYAEESNLTPKQRIVLVSLASIIMNETISLAESTRH